MINIEQFVKDAIQKNKDKDKDYSQVTIACLTAKEARRETLVAYNDKQNPRKQEENIELRIKEMLLYINKNIKQGCFSLDFYFLKISSFSSEINTLSIVANFLLELGYNIIIYERENEQHSYLTDYIFFVSWGDKESFLKERLQFQKKGYIEMHTFIYNEERYND